MSGVSRFSSRVPTRLNALGGRRAGTAASILIIGGLSCLMVGSVWASGAVAQAAAPNSAVQQGQLAIAAAEHVGHAGQAMLLASARAGSRVVAVGDHGIILLSDDNGRSFRQAKTVPIDSTLTAVSFADDQHGWAVGQWGVILQSTDAGETWTLQRSDLKGDRPLFAVHFFDARHGVAVGLWSLVLSTVDGGRVWTQQQLLPPEGSKKADLNLLAMFADDHRNVYATAEKGMLLKSGDQGRTWAYLATGYKGSFWTGIALPDGVLLAAGLRGSLYRSADEGKTWSRIETNSKSSITALAHIGNEVVAVGLDGLELRSKDGGTSFSGTPRADRLPLTSIVAAADGRAVLFSRQGVVAGPMSEK